MRALSTVSGTSCFAPNAAFAFGADNARSQSIILNCGKTWGITALSAIFIIAYMLILIINVIINENIGERIRTQNGS